MSIALLDTDMLSEVIKLRDKIVRMHALGQCKTFRLDFRTQHHRLAATIVRIRNASLRRALESKSISGTTVGGIGPEVNHDGIVILVASF